MDRDTGDQDRSGKMENFSGRMQSDRKRDPQQTLTSNTPGHVIIGEGTELHGNILSCKRLEVCGIAKGEFKADEVVIGEGGELRGEVDAQNAIVQGILDGNLNVENKLDIRDNGIVSGDVSYLHLRVEDGGSLRGTMTMKGAEDELSDIPGRPKLRDDAEDLPDAVDDSGALKRIMSGRYIAKKVASTSQNN